MEQQQQLDQSLITCLKYPLMGTLDINNRSSLIQFVVWLEDRKIREYEVDERAKLRVDSELWDTYFSEYLAALGCPFEWLPSTEPLLEPLSWLLSCAVAMEYEDYSSSANNVPVLEIIQQQEEEEEEEVDDISAELNTTTDTGAEVGVTSADDVSVTSVLSSEIDRLAALLNLQRLPAENDASVLSRCNKTIRLYFSTHVVTHADTDAGSRTETETGTEMDTGKKEGKPAATSCYVSSTTTKPVPAPPSMELANFPLGFSMGDPLLDQAALVLKMLYLFDFRELQDDLNNIIILGQEYTANPKTNASLGRIRLAPFLTSGMLVLTIVTLAYVASESLVTHAAAEFENRFWSLMVFLFLVLLGFSPDSPFSFGMESWVSVAISWIVILFITFMAHNYDRHLVRLKLKKLPKIDQMKRSLSTEFGQESKIATKEKLKKLNELSNFIDQQWFASTFVNLFWLGNVLLIERQIIDIFKEADAKQLNYILSDFPIAHLFYKVKDHWYVRDYHRTQLLELLTVERLGVLTVKSRVMLLHGLQLKKLSANARSETYAKNIILKTMGDQLSELKCLTDSKGDYHNMHKLVYKDIRDPGIRRELLAHFAKQAQVQQAHSLMGSRAGKKRSLYAWRKIVCDVDDTLVCSGGSFPAGMDTSYPKKELYPGVLGFLRELDLGTTKSAAPSPVVAPAQPPALCFYKNCKSTDAVAGVSKVNYVWEENRLSNLVFLSARPHVYSDISEQMTYGKFENLRKNRGLHGNPTLLCGALDTGAEFIVKNDMEPLAVTKFTNYCEYSAVYPEFKYVFIGDNGQGDVRVSEMILTGDGKGNSVGNSSSSGSSSSSSSSSSGSSVNDVGGSSICGSTTALRDSLERVYIHQVQPLHKTHVKSNSLLTGELSKHVCYFTTYVEAATDAFRHGLIKISGLRNIIEEAKADVEMITPEGWTNAAKSSGGGGGGGRLRDERVRELNQSIHAANKVLLAHGESCALPILFKMKFANGTVVRCSYGVGIVERFYPVTGFYHVAVPTQVSWCSSRGALEVSYMHMSIQGLQLNSFKSVSISGNNRLGSGPVLQSLVNASYKDGSKTRSLLSISSTTSIVGYVVWTPYGTATVTAVRPKESLVECHIAASWGGRCFLQYDKVVVISPPVAPPTAPAPAAAAAAAKPTTRTAKMASATVPASAVTAPVVVALSSTTTIPNRSDLQSQSLSLSVNVAAADGAYTPEKSIGSDSDSGKKQGYFSIVNWLFSPKRDSSSGGSSGTFSRSSSAADGLRLLASDGSEDAGGGCGESGETRGGGGCCNSGRDVLSCQQRPLTVGDWVLCAPFGACVIVGSRVDTYPGTSTSTSAPAPAPAPAPALLTVSEETDTQFDVSSNSSSNSNDNSNSNIASSSTNISISTSSSCGDTGSDNKSSSSYNVNNSNINSNTGAYCVTMYELRKLDIQKQKQKPEYGDVVGSGVAGMAGVAAMGEASLRIFSPETALSTFMCGEPGHELLQTPYGVGVLLAVQQPCGIHVVKSVHIPSMVMYLHPQCVWRYSPSPPLLPPPAVASEVAEAATMAATEIEALQRVEEISSSSTSSCSSSNLLPIESGTSRTSRIDRP